MGIREVGDAIKTLKETYNKEVMIVEVAYPWTLEWDDNAGNILGEDNLLNYYNDNPSTGTQRDFLTELSWLVKHNGGNGVIYWEPAWVSTECGTQWAEQGSHLENAVFFDFNWQLHEGIEFMDYDYTVMPASLDSVPVTFKVDMTGIDTSEGVYVTGDFTGEAWQFMPMFDVGDNIFEYQGKIPGRSYGAYIFQNMANWNVSSRENVPAECALFWDTHRAFTVGDEPTEFAYVWSSCTKIDEVGTDEFEELNISLSPNPVHSTMHIQSGLAIQKIKILNLLGIEIYSETLNGNKMKTLYISGYRNGIYILKIQLSNGRFSSKKFLKNSN
jgi:arabinogalactan endo-1,4-beta-galactosidase